MREREKRKKNHQGMTDNNEKRRKKGNILRFSGKHGSKNNLQKRKRDMMRTCFK